VRRPSDLRISCRPSGPRPLNPTLPLAGREEGHAPVGVSAHPACRLHARVGRDAGHNPMSRSQERATLCRSTQLAGSISAQRAAIMQSVTGATDACFTGYARLMLRGRKQP
jgi:hypothetical protein